MYFSFFFDTTFKNYHYLCNCNPCWKPTIGLRWGYIYINKGVTDALVLTVYELRNFNCRSETKQWGRPMGCIIYSPHWLRTCQRSLVGRVNYIHASAWGFRHCSFRLTGAMRRPIDRGTSSRLAPRFRFCISKKLNINCQSGSRWPIWQ